MTEDLLAKEKEFHRLNRELGRKTKDLMREVDSVLVSHSASFFPTRGNETTAVFHDSSPNFSQRGRSNGQTDGNTESSNQRCSEGSVELENLTVEEIVSSDVENSRSDAFVRFLKAKIKLLHDELRTSRLEYKKKCGYCKELEAENKKSEEASAKLVNNVTSLKDAIAKLEANNSDLRTNIQARVTENAALKKEIYALTKELKAANQQSSNFDVRLNRSSEEIERLRNVVKFHKIEEKELRDQIRRLQESERLSTNRLERQRSEILQAFRKQTSLVDNLKRQKANLEASRKLQFSEEEFSKLLDLSEEKS